MNCAQGSSDTSSVFLFIRGLGNRPWTLSPESIPSANIANMLTGIAVTKSRPPACGIEHFRDLGIPQILSAEEREAIRQLAADIPALWNAATATDADRKEILRQVVERVEVEAQGTSEQVQVRITWAGGGQTEGVLVRPIARYADRSDYARLGARVQELTTAGWSLEAIARQLEADGYLPLRSTRGWSVSSVQTLRYQLGLGNTHRHGSSRETLGPHEWWVREMASRLEVSSSSLLYWIEHGLVRARKEQSGWHRWIVWADAAELERLQAYRHRDIAAEHRRRWTAVYTAHDPQKDLLCARG
jgi:hypothetical protein